MGSGKSKISVTYENGKPTFSGKKVTKGFEQGNGLLFRIADSKSRKWAYYNDTKDYEMHIKVTFNPDCDIQALGNTTLEKLDNGEYVASLVVAPLQTEMFIKGRVNGFKSKMDAFAISS